MCVKFISYVAGSELLPKVPDLSGARFATGVFYACLQLTCKSACATLADPSRHGAAAGMHS